MTDLIGHTLLDLYERTSGDPARLPPGEVISIEAWEAVDELLLDLHLVRHGYADDEHARQVERQLSQLCVDEGVAGRIRAMRL